MTRAVIAGFARTPFHFANKGKLAGVRPDDLAAIAIKGLVERSGIDPKTLEDVVLGVAYPEAEQGSNIARLAARAAQIMKRQGKRFALATQCIGGGQGIATVIEAA